MKVWPHARYILTQNEHHTNTTENESQATTGTASQSKCGRLKAQRASADLGCAEATNRSGGAATKAELVVDAKSLVSLHQLARRPDLDRLHLQIHS